MCILTTMLFYFALGCSVMLTAGLSRCAWPNRFGWYLPVWLALGGICALIEWVLGGPAGPMLSYHALGYFGLVGLAAETRPSRPPVHDAE